MDAGASSRPALLPMRPNAGGNLQFRFNTPNGEKFGGRRLLANLELQKKFWESKVCSNATHCEAELRTLLPDPLIIADKRVNLCGFSHGL